MIGNTTLSGTIGQAASIHHTFLFVFLAAMVSFLLRCATSRQISNFL